MDPKVIARVPSVLAKAAALALGGTLAEFIAPGSGVAAGIVFNGVAASLSGLREVRVQEFLVRLSSLVRELDPELFVDIDDGPARLDLFETGLFASARASTETRIDYIASIVSHGMTKARTEALRNKRLLSILDELNESEFLILASLGRPRPEQDKFWKQHAEALIQPLATRFSEVEVVRAAAVHRSYYSHLEQLDLIAGTIRQPTDLGRALLAAANQRHVRMPDVDERYDRGQKSKLPTVVPAYWESLKPLMFERLAQFSRQTGLAPPALHEPQAGLTARLTLAVQNRDRPSLEVFANPNDGTIYCSYRIGPEPIPGQQTGGREIGKPRRVDVRVDDEGPYALVGPDRVYTLATIADFLVEPIADFFRPHMPS